MTAIRLAGVCFSRRAGPVLEGVDLAVGEGERVAVLGASGSGKSTLLRLIAGLERADAGTVEVLGRPVHGPRREVTMVFQEAAPYEHLDVAGNLEFPLRASDSSPGDVDATAGRFSIRGLLSRRPSTLSLGQRGVVAAARAVVRGDVEVVLLDEALVGTDPHRRRRLVDVIMTQPDITVVFATNDPVGAFRWADRLVVLAGGGVAQRGTPIDIYRRPRSLTVAELTGEINRLPGTVHRVGDWQVEVGSSRLRFDPVPEGLTDGQRVVVGVRPSDLTDPDPGIPFDRRLQGTVGRIEPTGVGQRLLFGLGTTRGVGFVAESSHRARLGDTLEWYVPPDRVQLFDPVTELLL